MSNSRELAEVLVSIPFFNFLEQKGYNLYLLPLIMQKRDILTTKSMPPYDLIRLQVLIQTAWCLSKADEIFLKYSGKNMSV